MSDIPERYLSLALRLARRTPRTRLRIQAQRRGALQEVTFSSFTAPELGSEEDGSSERYLTSDQRSQRQAGHHLKRRSPTGLVFQRTSPASHTEREAQQVKQVYFQRSESARINSPQAFGKTAVRNRCTMFMSALDE